MAGREDWTSGELADAVLAELEKLALPGPAPEPPPWPDMRPDYQRSADAVSTCGAIREAVAWIEEEARRDLRAAQPAPDPEAIRLDDPRFIDAVQDAFDAPGEWGPAQGYYRGDVLHFIDMV